MTAEQIAYLRSLIRRAFLGVEPLSASEQSELDSLKSAYLAAHGITVWTR